MNKITKVPKLRFPKFTDEWEQRKLGDIYVFQYGEFNNNPDNGGKYPIYGANGIIGGYTEYNSENAAVIGHMGAYAGYVVWAEGKHFVTYNGTIAKPSDDSTDSKYGYYLLSSKQINRICAGSGQPFVSYNDLNNIDVVVPNSKEEQTKIGEYFTNLDNLITLHQRKLVNLNNIKKSMLGKLFPKKGEKYPEVRFEGFTGEWEQRKVSDITKFHKQGFYTTEAYDNNKKYYLLRGTDLTENKLILKDTPKINATERKYQAFRVEIGDFLIVRSGTVGTYGIVYDDIPAIFGSYLIDFRFDTKQVVNEFFGYFYQSDLFKKQLSQIVQRSANTNINAENIKSTSIMLPTLDEQKRISGYLSKLDNLITLHQRKLDNLKNIKKGFLQQMFA